MKIQLYRALSGLVFASSLFFQPALAANYEIDAAHSSVGFKVKHLSISNVIGNFGTFEGAFEFDVANVSASSVKAVIDVASINTSQAKRDAHLRDADFFDVSKFPKMSFVSKRIEVVDADDFKIHGDLTIRNVTKPVVLDAHYAGTAIGMQGEERNAFDAKVVINRKDFGLTWSKVLETGAIVVGDDVTIDIHVEGVRK